MCIDCVNVDRKNSSILLSFWAWRRTFHPWVRKIPCRRQWQPTPGFWRTPRHRGAWWATVHGVTKESDTTERRNNNNNNDNFPSRMGCFFLEGSSSYRMLRAVAGEGCACWRNEWSTQGPCSVVLRHASRGKLNPSSTSVSSCPGGLRGVLWQLPVMRKQTIPNGIHVYVFSQQNAYQMTEKSEMCVDEITVQGFTKSSR